MAEVAGVDGPPMEMEEVVDQPGMALLVAGPHLMTDPEEWLIAMALLVASPQEMVEVNFFHIHNLDLSISNIIIIISRLL